MNRVLHHGQHRLIRMMTDVIMRLIAGKVTPEVFFNAQLLES